MNFQYCEVQPSAALQPYVECYWHYAFDGNTSQQSPVHRCLPFGMTELIFVNGRCEAYTGGEWRTLPSALIVGVYKDSVTWKCEGPTTKFGVRLKPESLWSLFNVPASELFNNFLDQNLVFGSYIRELTEQMEEAKSLQQYIRIVESFLLKLQSQRNQLRNYVSLASDIIRKADGSISIASLSDQLNISRRQLERSFRDTFGTSPKTYTRIIRFRNTYSFLLKKRAASIWTDAAYNFGYADQAHFIKEFKTFAGVLPTGMIHNSVEFFQSKGEKYKVEMLLN